MELRATAAQALMAVLLLASTAASAEDVLVQECPFAFTGGDKLSRGFYIPEYPADDLSRVELLFATTFTDVYTISLTARLDTYDGPLLDTDTIVVELVAPSTGPEAGDGADVFLGDIPTVLGAFEFDAAAVPPGSTVTFALELLDAPGFVFYDVGPCDSPEPGCEERCTGQVVQTNGTEPPLDSFRRDSVGIRVYEAPPADVPAASGAGTGLLALLLLAVAARWNKGNGGNGDRSI